jgi:hypothetical protein
MRRTILCAVVALLLGPAHPQLANAQSAADAVREFGLIGTWAGDCKEEASPANSYATYVMTQEGSLQLKYQTGTDEEDTIRYEISAVKPMGADKLSLRQALAGNDRIALDIVLLKQDGKIRIWSSLFADGTALVEDGVMTAMTGRETRWLARCP